MKSLWILAFYLLVFPSTQAQTITNLTLLPGERFEHVLYFYYSSLNPPGTRTYVWELPENTPWLTGISPTTGSTSACNDLFPVKIQLQAPDSIGFYTAQIVDVNPGIGHTITVNLSVDTNLTIPASQVLSFNLSPDEVVDFTIPIEWSHVNPIGCAPTYFPPDSLQSQFFSVRNTPWLQYPIDTILVAPSTYYPQTFTIQAPTDPGNYTGYLTHFREYRSLPLRYRINVSVLLPSNTTATISSQDQVGLPYPNPFIDQVAIPLHLKNLSLINYTIYNSVGINVQQGRELVDQGSNELIVKMNQMKAGSYIIVIQSESARWQVQRKLVVR